MRCWLVDVVLFPLVLTFTSLFVYSTLNRASASNSPVHWEGAIDVKKVGQISNDESLYPHYCSIKSTKQQRVRDYSNQTLNTLLGSVYIADAGEYCQITNASGTFALRNMTSWNVPRNEAVLYSPSSNSQFVAWKTPIGTTKWYDPAPQGGNVLYLSRPDGFTNYYGIQVEKNLREWGEIVPDRSFMKWAASAKNYHKRDLVKLKFADNSQFSVQMHAFSGNGRYLAVAEHNSVGVIDLATLKITYVYGKHSLKRHSLAISNDGKFLAIGYVKNLELVDISGCATQFAFGEWPRTPYSPNNEPHQGCRMVKEFSNELTTAGFSGLGPLRRPYFSANGESLFISIGKDPNNTRKPSLFDWFEYEFKALDYVPGSDGYLAMGDSFSSGEGDTNGGTWYEPGTDERGDKSTFAGRNLCHLSRRSYPYLIAMELGYLGTNASSPPAEGLFHSVACSGAKIHNVIGLLGEKHDAGAEYEFAYMDNQYRFDRTARLSLWQPGITKQLFSIIPWESPDNDKRAAITPEIITIGIGGNDGGFGDFISACTWVGTCEYAQPGSLKATQLATMIAGNKQRLAKTFKNIKTSAPEARVYVHGYPIFIRESGGSCGLNVRLDDQERRFAVAATRYMNQVIRAAAEEAGVVYVDVENIMEGGRLCDEGEKYFNGATAGNDIDTLICPRNCIGNESYHPNPEGFKLYKDAIIQQTAGLTQKMPLARKNVDIPLPQSEIFGEQATQNVSGMNRQNNLKPDISNSNSIIQDDSVEGMSIKQDGFYPGSEVDVEVRSTPTHIGTLTADNSGKIIAQLSLPQLVPGYHELHLLGYDSYGNAVDLYQSFLVGFSHTDFDGDGIENEADNCPTIINSVIDQDNDGIDDACDGVIMAGAADASKPLVTLITTGNQNQNSTIATMPEASETGLLNHASENTDSKIPGAVSNDIPDIKNILMPADTNKPELAESTAYTWALPAAKVIIPALLAAVLIRKIIT